MTHIKSKTIFSLVLMVLIILSLAGINAASEIKPRQSATITLTPLSDRYTLTEVRQGAVKFKASIRNEKSSTITIAHPSICFPADYKIGHSKYFTDSHGKSEILLKVIIPDGTRIILRDGYMNGFDPGNLHFLTIGSSETGTFEVGWFFLNARGKWEEDDAAARLFTSKGKYKISLLFRNYFPNALLYKENDKELKFVDVWTGEMESEQITVVII